VRRRDFLTLLGGAAAWPLAARAQQPERVRRIGVLVHGSRSGAVWQQRLAAFRQGLEVLGWQEGRNIHIDTLFSDNDYDRLPRVAQELVASGPEVIFANAVWKAAGMEALGGCLCIGCLEKRLGRRLKPKDFERDHEFNSPQIPGTPRLMKRRKDH
jgi:hypothetical protein